MLEPPPDTLLSIGDLIGRSFRVFRNKAVFFFTVLAWPCILTTACVALLKDIFVHWRMLNTLSYGAFVVHWLGMFACVIVLTIVQWDLALRSLALVRMIIGCESDYKNAYQYARKCKWSVLLVYSLAVVIPALFAAGWVVLGLIAAGLLRSLPLWSQISVVMLVFFILAIATTVIIATLATSLAFTILAFDSTSLKRVLSQTFHLTYHFLWRGGAFFLLTGVCLGLVAFAFDMPIVIWSVTDACIKGGRPQATSYNVPIALELFAAVWHSLLNILLMAVALIADGYYFNDLKLRAEGVDILSKLSRLRS